MNNITVHGELTVLGRSAAEANHHGTHFTKRTTNPNTAMSCRIESRK